MKVLFATPAYSGAVGVGYFASMSQTIGHIREAADVVFWSGDALVGRARNGLVRRFLESDATHLFFIDADLEWDPLAPVQMLRAEKAAVMGLYPLKQDAPDYPVSFLSESSRMENGLLPIAHGPAGFLCLAREALEKVIAATPELAYDGGHNLFQTEIKGGVFWGEDTAFCERWRAAGLELWARPDIDFKHTGSKSYAGNFWKRLVGQA